MARTTYGCGGFGGAGGAGGGGGGGGGGIRAECQWIICILPFRLVQTSR